MEKSKESFLELAERAYKARAKFDESTTLDIIKEIAPDIVEGIIGIKKKYKNELNYQFMNPDEKYIFMRYITVLYSALKSDCTMAKVVPQSEIKYYLELKRGFKGCFTRYADFKSLISNSNDNFMTIFNDLRLDYKGTEFNPEKDEYMGLVVSTLTNFSVRVPALEEFANSLNGYEKRVAISKDEMPFAGIGFTASEFGIPEFYISITNDKSDRFGAFPIEAFSSKFYLIQHNSEIIDFASFDCGDYEVASDDKFIINGIHKEVANKYGW